MSAPTSYGIVGAGMLGLTLALRLRQAGHAVTLYEAAPEIGGLAGAWSLGDIVWDKHYHVTLLSDANTRGVLAELGLENDMNWVTTKTGCYGDGKLVSVSNTVEFLRFPLLGLIDKMRLAGTIIYASRANNWQALEQVSVEAWLRRWSGNRTYERFWRPLLISKLGAAYRDTSAAFIWATIQRLYAARNSGLKEEKFGYVRGGYARILKQFAKTLSERGVSVRMGVRIASIRASDGRVAIQHDEARTDNFDRVVITTAPSIAAALCPDLNASERARLSNVSYLGIVCASVLLSRPLAGYYVTNLVDDGFPFTGVIEMSALVPPDELGDHHLVYLPRYLAPGDDYASKTDDEIRSDFLVGLRRIFPDLREDQIKAFRLSRARNVMPIPTIGYSKTVAPLATSSSGLFLANSSQIVNGTLNVNETVGLANRAFKELTA